MQLFRRMGCVPSALQLSSRRLFPRFLTLLRSATSHPSLAHLSDPPRSPHLFSLRPRVILVERFGQLVGLVSVKDCLKYTLAHEHGHDHDETDGLAPGTGVPGAGDELEATLEELRLWGKDVKRWIVEKVTGRSLPSSPETVRMGTRGFSSTEDTEDEATPMVGRGVDTSASEEDRRRRFRV